MNAVQQEPVTMALIPSACDPEAASFVGQQVPFASAELGRLRFFAPGHVFMKFLYRGVRIHLVFLWATGA
jgi:hypothetical protein